MVGESAPRVDHQHGGGRDRGAARARSARASGSARGMDRHVRTIARHSNQGRATLLTAATARQNEAPRTVTAKRNLNETGGAEVPLATRCGTGQSAKLTASAATRTQTGMEPAGALGHAGKDQDATATQLATKTNSRSPSSP